MRFVSLWRIALFTLGMILGGLVAVTTARADQEVALKYGLGVFGSAKDSHAEVKTFSLSHQETLFYILTQQYELGMWSDTRSDLGRSGSGYGFYSVGVNVDLQGVYVQSLWGAGLITSTDSMLGGHFQFTQDLGIGFKDSLGRGIGIDYKHISSAGIESPNKGRDFFMIRVSLPWM